MLPEHEHLEHQKVEHVPEVPIKSPEQIKPVDQAFEDYKKVDEKKPEESPYVVKQASKTPADQTAEEEADKTALQIEIESVLASGLDTAYATMTPPQQEKFRKKGEEVAQAIEDMALKFKLTARRVLKLITDWLRMIPGVNKYFLEQEAKLKTDDIIALHRKRILDSQQKTKY